MNAEQKRAWLLVVSMIVCVVAFLALMPFVGVWPATAAFGLFGVNGFAGLIGRKDPPPDERDRSIARHATLAGAMASYLAFILGCMGVWFGAFAFQGRSEVSVHLMPTITCLAGVVFWFARAVAVLVAYGRHVEADNG